MPTVRDLGMLAEAVYDLDGSCPSGWTLIDWRESAGKLDGFQVGTYQRGAEIVVAFRGTAQAVDAGADLKLGTGMNSDYFAQGDDYVADFLDNSNVFVCGHSLGGAIAQVIANRGGFKFATFNAPGVAVLASRNMGSATAIGTTIRVGGMMASSILSPVQAYRDVKATFNQVHGLNVCLNNDVVSRIGVHYGNILRIPGTSANPLTEHKIATVNSVLATHPVGQQLVQAF